MINVIYNNGTTDIYLDKYVKSVTWSGDITQAARRLEVSLNNTVDGRTRAVSIEKGRELRLLNEGKELFRGVIFRDSIDARGQMTLTAYDENIYLIKNQDTRKFVKVTASAIVRQLCNDFGIPTGTIENTGYVIPKLILRDKSLWDMMITALTYTRKQTGRRFFITSSGGKLNLFERKTQVVRWVLENGRNILDATYDQSIEDMRTQVKVIGGDETKSPIIATVKNDELIKQFGTMQHLEQSDPDITRSQLEQLAKQLLTDLGTIADDAGIEALGNDEVYAGKAVYVREQMTGITGGYFIQTDSHRFENGTHTMSLTLSATDELPTMEYEDPEPKQRKEGVGIVDQIFNAKGTG